MGKDLNIVFEIQDLRLAEELSRELQSLSSINLIHSVNDQGDRGTSAFKSPPQIILLEDRPDSGDISRRLVTLHRSFPLAAIFVISADHRPEHIVEVMKAGAAEFFVTPVQSEILQRAVERVREQRGRCEGINLGACYSFISSKGGLGSTSIAVNTAALLAERKSNPVVLCDLCFQAGDDSTLLDIVHEKTITDLCLNFHRLDALFLKGVLARHVTGLNFLPAPNNPEDGEEVRPEHVEKIFTLLRETHSTAIIDCPSMTINDCTVQAFASSDKVFVVIDLSVPAVRNASRFFQLIRKLGLPPQKIEFVVNRYIKSMPLSLESAEKTLGKRIFWIFPNDFENIFASINRGVPLATFNASAPLSKNLGEFIQKLLNPAAANEYRGMRGTFGKII